MPAIPPGHEDVRELLVDGCIPEQIRRLAALTPAQIERLANLEARYPSLATLATPASRQRLAFLRWRRRTGRLHQAHSSMDVA